MRNTSSQFFQHPNESDYLNCQPNPLLANSYQQYTHHEQEPPMALGFSENYAYYRNPGVLGNSQNPAMNGQFLPDNPPAQLSISAQTFQNTSNPLIHSVNSHTNPLNNSVRSVSNQLSGSAHSDGNPLNNSVCSDFGVSGLSKSTCSLPRNDPSTLRFSMNTPTRFNGNSRSGYPYQPQHPPPPGKSDKVLTE